MIDKQQKIYVMAGSIMQAMHYSRSQGFRPADTVAIRTPTDLRGIDGRGEVVYTYGTCYELPSFGDCYEEAKRRGFRVERAIEQTDITGTI